MIEVPDNKKSNIFLHFKNIAYIEGQVDIIDNIPQLFKNYMLAMNKDTITFEEITNELNVLLELKKQELLKEKNKYNILNSEKD